MKLRKSPWSIRLAIVGLGAVIAAATLMAPAASAAPVSCVGRSSVVLNPKIQAGATVAGTLQNCSAQTVKVQFTVGSTAQACTTLKPSAWYSYWLTPAERVSGAALSWQACGATTPTHPSQGTAVDFLNAPAMNTAICSTSTALVGMSSPVRNAAGTRDYGDAAVYNCTTKPTGVEMFIAISEPTSEVPSEWKACTMIPSKGSLKVAVERQTDRSRYATKWRPCTPASINMPVAPIPSANGFSCAGRTNIVWTTSGSDVVLFNCTSKTEVVGFNYTDFNPATNKTVQKFGYVGTLAAGSSLTFDGVDFGEQVTRAKSWQFVI